MTPQPQGDTPVLIAGAGPVGLTLALDLAHRQVPCTLIEVKPGPTSLPKMDRTNSRSMEIYRRLGISEKVRAASYPPTANFDVHIVTSLADEPLVSLRYPSVDEVRAAISETRDGTLPLEPHQIVSQYTLEPLLFDELRNEKLVDLRTSTEVIGFDQDDEGVTAYLKGDDGETCSLRASYLVGADGGRSTVRKALNIKLEGEGRISSRYQVFLRSKNLFEICPVGQARMFKFAHPDRTALTVQDDLEHFTFSTNRPVEMGPELDEYIRSIIGLPIDLEILDVTGWTMHLLVAEHYRDRRAFIAGDAAHLVIPSGGLGLNTGIGDATDLAWKLAATIQGWGGPGLLDSYDQERRPVGRRNRDASRYANAGQRAWGQLANELVGEDSPEGRGSRRAIGHIANVEQRKTHEMTGTELGYRYEDSPIICREDGPWPPDVREVYIPTARPGARLPHMWTKDKRAVQDLAGPWFTVLSLGPEHEADAEKLADSLRNRSVPAQVAAVNEPEWHEVYRAGLLLLRPDLHVAWRGDRAPDDIEALSGIVTGHTPESDPA